LLPNISSKVLSQRLKDLEKANLTRRDVAERRPPVVKYSLTQEGNLIVKRVEHIFLYFGFAIGFYTKNNQ